jgi:uncharacterized tellurite resistance protein B-like protein
MDAKEHLYYAIGEFAYALAKADGNIQREEKQKLHQIVTEELKDDPNYAIAEIIFSLLEKQRPDLETAYENAKKALHLGNDHLTNQLRTRFITLLEKIAMSFPPRTPEEHDILNRFREDLALEMKDE